MQPVIDVTKFAIIYPRQSTAAQVDKNVFSLENQLRLQYRALADGFPEDKVIVIDDDLGVSARTIERRVGMTRALALIDQGQVGALYAEDQTRLSRDIHSVDHMEIGKRCRLARVPIYMGGAWRDLTNRGDRLVYKVDAVIGSEMWSLHQDKMYEAVRTKAAKGQYIPNPPRGYRKNRDVKKDHPDYHRLVIHEPEAEVIRSLMARLKVEGSISKLYSATYPLYWPDGVRIKRSIMFQVFSNPVYRGTAVFKDIVVEDAHPAILSKDDAAWIDRLKDLNKTTVRKRTKEGLYGILSGLAWCVACQGKARTNSTRGHGVYRCRASYPEELERLGSAHHFSLKCETLDAAVMRELWARLLNGKLVSEALFEFERRRAAAAAAVELEDGQVRTLKRKREGFLMTLGMPDLDPTARRLVVDQLTQVAQELAALQAEKPQVRHLDADIARTRELLDRGILARLADTWPMLDLKTQREFVRQWVERADIERTEGGFNLALHYVSGAVSKAFVAARPVKLREAKREWSVEEDRMLRKLYDDPARPEAAWPQWVAERMLARGCARTKSAVYNRAKFLELTDA